MNIHDLTLTELLAENRRRNNMLKGKRVYNPRTGNGCYGARKIVTEPESGYKIKVPVSMTKDTDFNTGMNLHDWNMLRFKHDFEFWASECIHIRHKISGQMVKFRLNYPQRQLLKAIESKRLAHKPIRIALLKARQWGGSTLVQMYFAWMQCCRRTLWHSLICAHVRDTASSIRGLYSSMLRHYPEEYRPEGKPMRLGTFEGTSNIRIIEGRECHITVASSVNPESVRGLDCSMAHMSEVAFWKDSDISTPEQLVRSVCGGIPMVADTIIVMESTANGAGNYFHESWLKAMSGDSAFTPVFIPWYDIEMYAMKTDALQEMLVTLTPYEQNLWEKGLTLEQIWWYHNKRVEIGSDIAMHSEYPTTAIEAFDATGGCIFDSRQVEEMRKFCIDPIAIGELTGKTPSGCGAMENIRFVHEARGRLKIWEMPVTHPVKHRYVVTVDVGGRSESADWSVIAVFDRTSPQGSLDSPPRVVAQWRGHIDHDLLAWKAAAIAKWYANALLVVESNTLETESSDAGIVLELIARFYNNTYVRRTFDTVTQHTLERVGFHTNRATKSLAIDTLLCAVRDGTYIERDHMALNEFLTYEQLPNGSYGARRKCHDDILMTRAIGLYVISTLPVTQITPDDKPSYRPRL